MKICILSMQRVPNFGSLLQGYSLKKILESLGHDVSFIDIEIIPEDNALLTERKITFSEERGNCSKRYIISKLSKIDKYFWNRLYIKAKSNKQNEYFEKFRTDILNIKIEDNEMKYDICVIGSDEVFNCLEDSKWGFTSQLFGNVRQANKVITYAASCGSTNYEMLSKVVRNKIKDVFSDVKGFSVRDKNTMDFVSNLTDEKVYMHYDPVLVGDFTEEMSRVKTIHDLPYRYCVVYSYYNRIHREEEIQEIKRFCTINKLEIVTIGAPQMWVRKHLVLTPFEALVAFTKATFVITDTFHGTIFAAKFTDRFATMARPSNRNKLLDLVCKLDIKEHLVEKINEIDKVYEIINGKVKIERKIAEQQIQTKKYLSRYLHE